MSHDDLVVSRYLDLIDTVLIWEEDNDVTINRLELELI